MTGTLLTLGHGYSAQALARLLLPQGWQVIGSTRAPEKAAAIAAIVAQRIATQTAAVAGLDGGAWVRVFPDLLRVVPSAVRLWAYDGATEVDTGSNAPIRAARKLALSREIGDRMPTATRNPASRAYLPKVKAAVTDYSL